MPKFAILLSNEVDPVSQDFQKAGSSAALKENMWCCDWEV